MIHIFEKALQLKIFSQCPAAFVASWKDKECWHHEKNKELNLEGFGLRKKSNSNSHPHTALSYSPLSHYLRRKEPKKEPFSVGPKTPVSLLNIFLTLPSVSIGVGVHCSFCWDIIALFKTIDMLFNRHNECRFYHIWAFVTTVVAGLWGSWRFLCWLVRQIVRQVWRVVVAPEQNK